MKVLMSVTALCATVVTSLPVMAASIAVAQCTVGPCNEISDLWQTARATAGNVPYGTTVLVSSDVYGLSAYFRTTLGARGMPSAVYITPSDAEMVELSQILYAKSVPIEPIDIPPAVAGSAGSATYELVQGYVLSVLNVPAPAQVGYDFWNGLTNLDIAQVVYMVFLDSRDVPPTEHRVHGNDRITVRFADGSTAQLRMAGPGAPSGHFFVWVPGSERDADGEPFAGAAPVPADGGSGSIDLTTPWSPGDIILVPSMPWCAVTAVVCHGIGGTICDVRDHILPCM